MFKRVFNYVKSLFSGKKYTDYKEGKYHRSESAVLTSDLMSKLLSIPAIEDGSSIYKVIVKDVEGGKVAYTRLVLDGEERKGLMYNPNYTTVPVAVYYTGVDRDADGVPVDLSEGVMHVLKNGASHVSTLRKRYLVYKNYVLVLHEELRKDFDSGEYLVCSWVGSSSHVYDLDKNVWVYDHVLRKKVNSKITLDNCYVIGGELPSKSQPLNYIAPSAIV
jgi:hypothetical protein